VMDHSVGALAPSTVAFIPHSALHELTRRYPGIAAALWRETLIDAAIFREWVTNVGSRSAYRRTAHVLYEFFVKMRSVGLATGDHCSFPLTQQEIGDATGLSVVHVNRTLQQLRGDGLIELKGRKLTILDYDGIAEAGQFDPSYLHLGDRVDA
jgi:CRP-like cAMP-binding protein